MRNIQGCLSAVLFASTLIATAQAAESAKAPPGQQWIADSNRYTQMLLDVQIRHSPEYGSSQGLSQYDPLISSPTLADDLAERSERDAVIGKIKSQLAQEKDLNVAEDMQILIHAMDLQDREQDFDLSREVPFNNASQDIYQGLRTLLDDQVAAERRPAAVARLRKYAGLEPGRQPYTDVLLQREKEQIAKPNVIYPSKAELETELGRNSNYVAEIPTLFKKYQLTGWESAYEKLKTQLADYDA